MRGRRLALWGPAIAGLDSGLAAYASLVAITFIAPAANPSARLAR